MVKDEAVFSALAVLPRMHSSVFHVPLYQCCPLVHQITGCISPALRRGPVPSLAALSLCPFFASAFCSHVGLSLRGLKPWPYRTPDIWSSASPLPIFLMSRVLHCPKRLLWTPSLSSPSISLPFGCVGRDNQKERSRRRRSAIRRRRNRHGGEVFCSGLSPASTRRGQTLAPTQQILLVEEGGAKCCYLRSLSQAGTRILKTFGEAVSFAGRDQGIFTPENWLAPNAR